MFSICVVSLVHSDVASSSLSDDAKFDCFSDSVRATTGGAFARTSTDTIVANRSSDSTPSARNPAETSHGGHTPRASPP